MSRSRLRVLIEEGRVTANGQPATDASAKVIAGAIYAIDLPAPVDAQPQPEDIPLDIVFEDKHLIVIDKPPGLVVHPAGGSERGTLVNALLFHCGNQLTGIGGVARPGIVHRLDKDTSGVMVAAKSEAAHTALTAMFAAHDIERAYLAVTRGAPRPLVGRIETYIGRSPSDRKKMAVMKDKHFRADHWSNDTSQAKAPSRPARSRSPTTAVLKPSGASMRRAHNPPPRWSNAGLKPDARTRSASTWLTSRRRSSATRLTASTAGSRPKAKAPPSSAQPPRRKPSRARRSTPPFSASFTRSPESSCASNARRQRTWLT